MIWQKISPLALLDGKTAQKPALISPWTQKNGKNGQISFDRILDVFFLNFLTRQHRPYMYVFASICLVACMRLSVTDNSQS